MPDTVVMQGVPAELIEERVKSLLEPGAEIEEIPEGNGLFTLRLIFPEPETPLPTDGEALNWAAAPKMDAAGPHTKFAGGQRWAYDDNGVALEHAPDAVLRSNGKPVTCTAILSVYGREIFDAATKHGVPPELIVMTIATETAFSRRSNFTGPDTFRWEARHTDYSAGPMQTMGATAREMIDKFGLPHPNLPRFATRPVPPPATNPLYDGKASIDIGTAYIRNNLPRTGFDPILVAAHYNAGSLREDPDSPWRLVTFGEHLNRAADWFGDACFLLGRLRRGESLDTSIVKPAPKVSTPNPLVPNDFVMVGLTNEAASEEQEQFEISGAEVARQHEADGTVTLHVTFPTQAGSVVAPPAANGVPAPSRDGYVLCVSRRRLDSFSGKRRTVGVYQAFFNRVPIASIQGVSVEPHGPGDNSRTGIQHKRCIAVGTYPLFTHAGTSGKYKTFNYTALVGVDHRAWPSVRVENTGSRSGILVHCGGGFMMSIGCINFAATLPGPSARIDFADSRRRVIALIDNMKTHLDAGFPSSNNRKIENAWLIVRDDIS